MIEIDLGAPENQGGSWLQKPKERPVNLLVWAGDGSVGVCPMGRLPVEGLPEVSVGRTDSRRALGFMVTRPDGVRLAEFVLDRDQVQGLRDHLDYQMKRLRKSKPKKETR